MCTCEHKHRLAAALEVMDLERDDVLEVLTAHDDDCGRYEERCCSCRPRISLKTTAGAIQIDPDGALRILNLN